MKHNLWINLLVLCGLTLMLVGSVGAQGPGAQGEPGAQAALGTGFTYQGRLVKDGQAVNDTCTFRFGLWDAAGGGVQVGNTQTVDDVGVSDGYFDVVLNSGNEFGSDAFAGQARYLQVTVQCSTDPSATSLGRVALHATPYALFAQRSLGNRYQNVIVVAQSGGDFTSIQAALESISDNDKAHRYLVWVAPGTYAERVTMKPHVDIEGAGELATTIAYPGSASANTGTVVGADHAELRSLTVENSGGDDYAIAIYNSAASPRLTHVTATASGADDGSGGGEAYGVLNHSSSPTMTHMTVTALGPVSGSPTCYGVYNNASSPTMRDMTVEASGTDGYGVYNDNASAPAMRDMVIRGGGIFGYGVYNNASSPTMTDLTITVWGTDANGVYNASSSSPLVTNVTITTDGLSNYGVYNDSSSLTLANSTIVADSEWGDGYGIYNVAGGGSYEVTVNNCQVTGGINAIVNDAGFTTRVGASLLDGGSVDVSTGGTVTCAGVYDEDYTFYSGTCP